MTYDNVKFKIILEIYLVTAYKFGSYTSVVVAFGVLISGTVFLSKMLPSVAEYYTGKSILVTGATGFMGKVLLEKLLRSCAGVNTIYVLIRQKKGLNVEDRLSNFSSYRVFEKLLHENPKAFTKVRLISGDILQERLGLSVKDEEELQRECQIVFSNAACVRFDMNLRDAVNNNTVGTQKMLKLAESMKKLEVFVHVSTAYCHDDVEVLEEKLYPSKQNPQDIINMLKWMDEETLSACQSKLIEPYPNTYGYTKCLSEQLVSEYAGKFTIAIARPSIVVSAWKDPMPGWVDNINGPTGITYAGYRGVLHTTYCKDDTKVNAVPVDVTINALLTLAYLTAIENYYPNRTYTLCGVLAYRIAKVEDLLVLYLHSALFRECRVWKEFIPYTPGLDVLELVPGTSVRTRPKDIRVCNVTQSGIKEITWIESGELGLKYEREYPLSYALWYPTGTGKNYKLLHKIDEFFTHIIPAYFIDFMMLLLGKKTFMIKVLKRLTHGLQVIEYYNNKTFKFKNDYFLSIRNQLSKDDRDTFYTDCSNLDVEEFMKNYVLGIREFYCKEDMSTLPRARKLLRRLYYLHVTTRTLFYWLCLYILYCIYNILRFLICNIM